MKNTRLMAILVGVSLALVGCESGNGNDGGDTSHIPDPPEEIPDASVDVTGTWRIESGFSLQLTQTGNSITGQSIETGPDAIGGTIQGQVSGNTVVMSIQYAAGRGGDPGRDAESTEMQATVDGNTMSGNWVTTAEEGNANTSGTFTATKQ